MPQLTIEFHRMVPESAEGLSSGEPLAVEAAKPGQEPWQDLAMCRGLDTELFFPDRGEAAPEALAACKQCNVAEQCREYAVSTGQRFGIWGGTSERQRRRLRAERQQQQGSGE